MVTQKEWKKKKKKKKKKKNCNKRTGRPDNTKDIQTVLSRRKRPNFLYDLGGYGEYFSAPGGGCSNRLPFPPFPLASTSGGGAPAGAIAE